MTESIDKTNSENASCMSKGECTMGGIFSRIAIGLCALTLICQPLYASCTTQKVDGSPRFISKGDEISDQKTSLIWQRCSYGMEWTKDKGCTGALKLLSFREAEEVAAKAGGGWRLPSLRELATLLDTDCGVPAVNKSVLSDIKPIFEDGSPYWTSTDAGMLNMTYYVDFMKGFVDAHSRGLALGVRLVRSMK
jgi:hypothetical protein